MFKESLEFGQLAESAIVTWLRSRGNGVLPVYEIEHNSYAGPRYFGKTNTYVAPDALVFSGDKGVLWCETKHKTVFSWHRISGAWVTGIDIHHYLDYQQIQRETGIPVWLVFLHRQRTPNKIDVSHCEGDSPVGLFGGSLSWLMKNENHRHLNHGKHGMVYWARSCLQLLADIEEVELSMKQRLAMVTPNDFREKTK